MNEDEKTLEQWRAQLTNADPIARLQAAYALAQRGNFEGRPVLLAALTSEDPGVRLEAAYMLGRIGARWTIGPLGALVRDRDTGIRNEAIIGLLETCRTAAVPFLIQALNDDDPERREDARVALVGLLGEEVIPYLSEFGEEDEGEAQRILQWWQENASKFDPDTCYDSGRFASIGAWIDRLKTASPAEADVLTGRLHFWTGVDLGPGSPPELADRWEAWWRENATSFQAGRRYFYGHAVDNGGTAL